MGTKWSFIKWSFSKIIRSMQTLLSCSSDTETFNCLKYPKCYKSTAATLNQPIVCHSLSPSAPLLSERRATMWTGMREGSAVTREPGAGADNRVLCWPADRSEVELQIVITGSGFTLTPLSIALFVFSLRACVFKMGDWHWSWTCQWGAKGVNQSLVTPEEKNPLRVKDTTANTEVGSVQGGSDSVRGMRGWEE